MAKEKPQKFSVIGLALGIGIYWGLAMLVAGWFSVIGWGNAFVQVMSSFYIGFESTFIGSIVGGIWGFVDGLIAGAVIAFFYNTFRK